MRICGICAVACAFYAGMYAPLRRIKNGAPLLPQIRIKKYRIKIKKLDSIKTIQLKKPYL